MIHNSLAIQSANQLPPLNMASKIKHIQTLICSFTNLFKECWLFMKEILLHLFFNSCLLHFNPLSLAPFFHHFHSSFLFAFLPPFFHFNSLLFYPFCSTSVSLLTLMSYPSPTGITKQNLSILLFHELNQL